MKAFINMKAFSHRNGNYPQIVPGSFHIFYKRTVIFPWNTYQYYPNVFFAHDILYFSQLPGIINIIAITH